MVLREGEENLTGVSESRTEELLTKNSADSEDEVAEPTITNKFAAFLATENQDGDDDDDDDEEENEPVVANKFDLLFANEDGDNEDEEEEDDFNVEREPSPDPVVKKAASAKKKQKKRKRKGKQKKEAEAAEVDEKDWAALTEPREDEFAPIPEEFFAASDDDALRVLAQEIFETLWTSHVERRAEQERSLGEYVSALSTSLKSITVDSRMLSADSELKKLFGARVVEAERRSEEAELAASAGRRRRGRRAHAGARIRKHNLVTPREGWMPSAPGLSMVLDTTEDILTKHGVRYFRYEYEGRYAKIQQEYREAVLTHNPNEIGALVSRYPFHVDGLLQLAELFRQMGELDRAAEHIERGICILEAAWCAAFRPWNGECRLRFDVAENKSLYVALSRYSQLLSRRGLHRTGLEISKLVLGFDPDNDPMGVLMIMDTLAILADEQRWLWEMNESFNILPLKHFPNFAVSAALALHSLQNAASGSGGKKSKKAKKVQEELPKALNDIDACKVLTDALLAFPMILRPLLAVTKDSGGAWSSHKMYGDTEDFGVLHRIARIYAARAHLLWTAPKAKALLHRAAEAATKASPSRVEEGRQKRVAAESWFVERGLYRVLQVADFSEGGPELNQELMAPDNDVPVGAAEVRNVGAAEAIREFVHSLLPWRDTNDAAAAAAAVVDGGVVDGLAVGEYANAVREFLRRRGIGEGQGDGGDGDRNEQQDEAR